jgi:hypothetical protein
MSRFEPSVQAGAINLATYTFNFVLVHYGDRENLVFEKQEPLANLSLILAKTKHFSQELCLKLTLW